MRLTVIRHGATDWSAAGLIQGRADRPLSPQGIAEVSSWRLPSALAAKDWLASPLRRAQETAQLLAGHPVAAESALIEMAWGEWEGRRLAELRRELGPVMAANEARGLDFRPPGGETPREVQVRLTAWLKARAQAEGAMIAVTHKGVMRALLGLATDWDFLGKPPFRLDWSCAHGFAVAAGGSVKVERLNIPLASP